MRSAVLVAGVAFALLAPRTLLAADVAAPAAKPFSTVPPDWTVTIGAEGRYLPSFDGSGRYVLRPYPIINVRRAGTAGHFIAPRDGWGIAIIDTGNFRLGPVGNVKLPRREDADDALRGLGNVGWAFELGLFAEYWPADWLRTRAEVRQGIGGHHGIVSDITADVVVPVDKQITLSAGPRLTLATGAALAPYYGIDPAQSLASGLPVYDPKGGVRSYGAGAQVSYKWSPKWESHAFIEYDRLTGDAANSPLLTRGGSPNQATVGVGASYTFDLSLFYGAGGH